MKESPQALRAFSDYLAQMPPRSLERLAQEYRSRSKGVVPTRQLSRLQVWSQQHHWQERVLEHERKIAQEAAKQARKQRLQVARAARGKGVEALALVAPAELARLPSAMVRLLEYADTCERKDLGEPDQRVALEGREGSPIVFTVNLDRAGADDNDADV